MKDKMSEKEKISTKQRIIEESLVLFVQNGYNGTSVKKIAEAVGIKDSSIYKHFRSKQEIFDQIVVAMSLRIQNMSSQMGIPGDDNIDEMAKYYADFSKEKLIGLTRNVVMFYLTDTFVVQFRKLAMREQYSNQMIYDAYQSFYMESSIEFMTILFKEMSEKGILKKSDPETMAYFFYSPIFLLMNKYDSKMNEEEVTSILDKIVGEFYDIYSYSK